MIHRRAEVCLKRSFFVGTFLSAIFAVFAFSLTCFAEIGGETAARAEETFRSGSGYIDFSGLDIRGEDLSRALYEINSAWNESCVFRVGDINIAAATYYPDYGSDECGEFLRGAAVYYRTDYISADGTCDIERLRKDIDTVAREFSEALSVVSDEMSEYEKARTLHDYVVNRAEYAEKSVQADGSLDYSAGEYTPEGVFLSGKAVCSGYAAAYAALLRASGIEAVVVNSAEMNHDWTMLKIGGDWYHADCTWDDTADGVIYDYFLKSDEEFEALGHYGWTVGMDEGYGGYGAAAPKAVKSGAVFEAGEIAEQTETAETDASEPNFSEQSAAQAAETEKNINDTPKNQKLPLIAAVLGAAVLLCTALIVKIINRRK